MEFRRLGRDGLLTSAIGLGSLGFTGGYGRVDQREAIATIRHALDLGVSMLDTADSYAGGEVERLIGRAVARRREDAVIATRGGARYTLAGQPVALDGSPRFLRESCDASLRRLRIDHIDLYYLNGVDRRVPVEESMGALAELVRAGKIRHIGLSAATAHDLARAVRVHPVAAIGVEYSLWDRQAEEEIIPTARRLGVGVVACCPLGRGFLSGQLTSPRKLGPRDYRRHYPRFWPENFPQNRRLLRGAEQVAARKDVGLGRLALAWLLRQGDDVVAVPGTRGRMHLEMNTRADRVRLTDDDCERLVALLPADAVAGYRLPLDAMAL